MEPSEDEKPPRVGRSVWKRFLLGGTLIVLLVGVTTAAAGLLEVKSIVEGLNHGTKLNTGNQLTPAEAGEPQTILVLGSDRRFADIKLKNPTRSDTMILVRLDPNKEATSVMSIPRDLKVDIKLPNGNIQTDKINAAYALGGPKLTLSTIKHLLGIKINHVVNINFGGFKRAVNFVGCVYADIDRRYFNDNSGAGPDYATIDIQPGYQKLCGADALDYVRFRHEDTDLVRAARQQDFLRQAKDQVGVKKIIEDRHALERIFGRYTQTDKSLHSSSAVISLLKLVIFSSAHPIQEVHFPGELGKEFVTVDPLTLRKTVHRFLNGKASKGPRGKLKSTKAERKAARKRKHKKIVAGLENAKKAGEDQAIVAQVKTPFPVYYPQFRTALALYAGPPRTYAIRAPGGKLYRAYRMTIKKGTVGEYYGIQGMTWKNPPILNNPSETRKVDGRKLELFFDGSRLRLVAWRTPNAVYWVSNTLLQSLTNKQMIEIASSLRRIG